MWAPDDIVHANMLFYPLCYDIRSVKSLKITQAFHLLIDFAENQGVHLDFKIQNSVRVQITEIQIIEVLLYYYFLMTWFVVAKHQLITFLTLYAIHQTTVHLHKIQ